MPVDDLTSPVSRFSQVPPGFPGKQVHIVMWERQMPPVSFQQPPTVQRTPAVVSSTSKPVMLEAVMNVSSRTVTPLSKMVSTAVYNGNGLGVATDSSAICHADILPVATDNGCSKSSSGSLGIDKVNLLAEPDAKSQGKGGETVPGFSEKVAESSEGHEQVDNGENNVSGQTCVACNCVHACTSDVCPKSCETLISLGPVTDALNLLEKEALLKSQNVHHISNCDVNRVISVSAGASLASGNDVLSAFRPGIQNPKKHTDGHEKLPDKIPSSSVSKPCTAGITSASVSPHMSSFEYDKIVTSQTKHVNGQRSHVHKASELIVSNQGGFPRTDPFKAETILKALVESDSNDLNSSEPDQSTTDEQNNRAAITETSTPGQSETSDRLEKIAQKVALLKSLSNRVSSAQKVNTSTNFSSLQSNLHATRTSDSSKLGSLPNSLQGTPVNSRSASPVNTGSRGQVDIFKKFLSDKVPPLQLTLSDSKKRKRTAAEFQGYIPVKKKVRVEAEAANNKVNTDTTNKCRSSKRAAIHPSQKRRGVQFSGNDGGTSRTKEGENQTEPIPSLKESKSPLKSALKSPIKSPVALKTTTHKVEVRLQGDNVDVETILHSLYKKLNLEPGTQAVIVGPDGKKRMTIHSPHHGSRHKGVTPSPSKCVKLNTENPSVQQVRKPVANVKKGVAVKTADNQMTVASVTRMSTHKKPSEDNSALSSSRDGSPSKSMCLDHSYDKSMPDLEKLFSGELSIPEPEDGFLQELFNDTEVFQAENTVSTLPTGSDAISVDAGDIDFDMLELGFSL